MNARIHDMTILARIFVGLLAVIGSIGGFFSNMLPADHPFVERSSYGDVEENISQDIEYVFDNDIELDGQSVFSGPAQPNVLWVKDIGGWGTEPVYGDDGTVYLGKLNTRSGYIGHITALNKDGSEKWRFNITEEQNSNCNPVPKDAGEDYESLCKSIESEVVSLARSKDGNIFVGLTLHESGDLTRPRDFSQSRFLLSVSPTGKENWRLDLGPNDVRSRITVAENGIMYFVAGTQNGSKYIYAVDQKNGAVSWKKDFGTGNINGPSIGKGGILYFGGDKVLAIDSVFGTLIWEYETRTVGAFPYGPAIGPDDTIYVLSTSDFNLHAINPDGSVKWKKNVGFAELIPAIDKSGTVYIHSWEDLLGLTNNDSELKPGLHAINLDGSVKWSKEGFFKLTENELNDEDVKNAGQKFGGSDSSITIDKNGILYFGTDQGRMYAIDSRDGQIVFEARFRGEFDNRPVITPDGTLVFCHHGGGGLYEGPRCIGMNDIGSMSPSPGILIEDGEDEVSDGVEGDSCFDVCVDAYGKSPQQCLSECSTNSDEPVSIPPGAEPVSPNQCITKCMSTGETRLECDEACGSQSGAVNNNENYHQCFDRCVDVEGKSESVCNLQCDS